MDEAGTTSTAQADGRRARVALRGDIDIVTAPDVREDALRVLHAPVEQVEVDLSGCTFLDSAGVALLGALWSRSRDLGATFVLLDPPTNVRVVLTIAGFAGLLHEPAPAEEQP